MTDNEIKELAKDFLVHQRFCKYGESVEEDYYKFYPDELEKFALAIEQRTLTNQKARWYQAGVEAERHDIAKMVETYCGAWDDKGQALVQMIRARE